MTAGDAVVYCLRKHMRLAPSLPVNNTFYERPDSLKCSRMLELMLNESSSGCAMLQSVDYFTGAQGEIAL